MPVPSAYTDLELADYMLTSLGELGTALDLSIDSFYEAVTDVLLAYGVSDLAYVTDIAKVRKLAKAAALRVAATKAATFYDVTIDGASYKKSQIMAQIGDLAGVWGVSLEADAMDCSVAQLAYQTDLAYPSLAGEDLDENAN